MASWFEKSDACWWQSLACRVLRAGRVPGHVAFIMDGNRRFARRDRLPSVLHGHERGFDRLAKTLEWCRDLGVREVTVYAFSIENFKRSADEVQALMDLASRKFQELLADKEKVKEYGVRFCFFGDMSRLPCELQRMVAEIALFTRHFDKACINVCLAYTAQDEMTRAVASITQGVQLGLLQSSDVSEELISACLDSGRSPDPDLLIRTSGEARMSDFMLWQCSHSCLYFDKVLWPEFGFWNLCLAILHYQRNFNAVQELRLRRDTKEECENERVKTFSHWLEERKLEQLRQLVT